MSDAYRAHTTTANQFVEGERASSSLAALHQRILQLQPDIVIKRCIFAGKQMEQAEKSIGEKRHRAKEQKAQRHDAPDSRRPKFGHFFNWPTGILSAPEFLAPSRENRMTCCLSGMICHCSGYKNKNTDSHSSCLVMEQCAEMRFARPFWTLFLCEFLSHQPKYHQLLQYYRIFSFERHSMTCERQRYGHMCVNFQLARRDESFVRNLLTLHDAAVVLSLNWLAGWWCCG